MYHPSSVFSVGIGSEPVQPQSFEALHGQQLKDRFSQGSFGSWDIRFEFENGAIDAQFSVNGGILLVATGHVVYHPPENGEDGDKDLAIAPQQRRKGFVHTFFLVSTVGPGNKKSFSVQNDILRFLQDDEEKTVIASNTTQDEEMLVTEPAVQLPSTVQDPPLSEVMHSTDDVNAEGDLTTAAQTSEVKDAPGGGVEESKESVFEDDQLQYDSPVDEDGTKTTGEELGVDQEPVRGDMDEVKQVAKEGTVATNGNKLEPVVTEEPSQGAAAVAKPPPGSWASLVASGKGQATSSAPSTPARSVGMGPKAASPAPTQAKPVTNQSSTDGPGNSTTNGSASNGSVGNNVGSNSASNNNKVESSATNRQPRISKRDPDCTLVIKNIAAETSETDVREMFEPFANETGTKVQGLTVSAGRGIAFVDFNSPKPVLAAVDKVKDQPMELHGNTLEIYQKTADQQNRRRNQGGRGNYRGGGQPGNGRHQYRRSGSGSGRGGDRGGGRGRGGRS